MYTHSSTDQLYEPLAQILPLCHRPCPGTPPSVHQIKSRPSGDSFARNSLNTSIATFEGARAYHSATNSPVPSLPGSWKSLPSSQVTVGNQSSALNMAL